MVNTAYGEKLPEESKEAAAVDDGPHDVEEGIHETAKLTRGLQGRHMQMIAIGTTVSGARARSQLL